MRKPILTKQMLFNVKPDVYKKVRSLAWHSEITMAKWIRTAVEEKLERLEQEKNDQT